MPDRQKTVRDAIEAINAISATDFDFKVRDQLQKAIEQRYRAGIPARQRRDKKKREKRRELETEWARMVDRYVAENIEPGMLIKVKGTRDGHGIRRVMKKIPSTRGEGGSLQCLQIRAVKSEQGNPSTVELVYDNFGETDGEPYEVEGITVHYYNKVIGLVRPTIDHNRFNHRYNLAYVDSLRKIINKQEES